MEFAARIEKFDGKLWYFYVVVPRVHAEPFMNEKNKRVLCSINGSDMFQCALMPNGKGDFFININKERRNKLDINLGDYVSVQLAKDESKYGLPMPDSFKELLSQDAEGNRLFHELTPGKQRNLLYIVGKVKSVDIQIRKGLVILQHLKDQGGTIDFRQLNEDFKNSRP